MHMNRKTKWVGSNWGQTRPRWHIRNQLENLDIFGKNLPTFNIKGKLGVYTALGGFISLVIFVITLAYGTDKFITLVERRNP